jgi:hypothetical protein
VVLLLPQQRQGSDTPRSTTGDQPARKARTSQCRRKPSTDSWIRHSILKDHSYDPRDLTRGDPDPIPAARGIDQDCLQNAIARRRAQITRIEAEWVATCERRAARGAGRFDRRRPRRRHKHRYRAATSPVPLRDSK